VIPKKDSLTNFGVTEKFDRADNKLFIRRFEDIEPVLDENAYARNHQGNNGYGKSRNWRKIGSIPMIVVEQILREKGVNILDGSPEADRYVRQYLQDNYKFRTVDKL
jgi:hypothetical protein